MKSRAATVLLLVFVPFAGKCVAEPALTLTGRYEYRTDSESLEMLSNFVCFYPSPEFAKVLPRPNSDTRLAWFCFTNKPTSNKLLGIHARQAKGSCGLTGLATVRVDNYIPYIGEGNGFDTASLLSVQKVSTPRALPCK